MALAFVRDPGLRVLDFIHAAQALDAVPADAFAAYGLNASAVTRVREQFADWPRDSQSDEAGHRAHEEAHSPPDSKSGS